MAMTTFGSTLENVWADYRRCAARSREQKKRLDAIRRASLILVILAPVLGVLASQLGDIDPYRLLAVASAIAAGTTAWLTSVTLDLGLERNWVMARSIGEGLKSEAFRYLARAEPYSMNQRQSDEILSEKADSLRESITVGVFVRISPQQILDTLPARDWLTMDQYLDKRVRNQIDYYEEAAEKAGRWVLWLKAASIGLGFVGVLLGALNGVYKDLHWLPAWLGVLGSATGAVTTYLFANRFVSLSQRYEITGSRLKRLLEAWDRVLDADKPARQSDFVNHAEEIMLLEHKQWVTEFDRPPRGADTVPPANAGPPADAPLAQVQAPAAPAQPADAGAVAERVGER
jgi:hypothetical protein